MTKTLDARFAVGRRAFLLAAALAATAPLGAGSALAQDDFPSEPIEIMVHAGAGGGTDLTAHALINAVREELGWDMALVRKVGAGGAVSHEYVLGRPCDGHTVITLTSSQIATIARGRSPLKIDDVVGVARATVDPSFLMASTDGPFETAQDFLESAREEPVSIGLVTIGGGDHITVFLLAERAGLEPPQVVPISSGGEAAINVVGGNIDAGMIGLSEAEGLIEAGKIKPLIAFTEKRTEDFPDVPTARELGVDLVRPTLRGFAVLACTPPERVDVLEEGFLQAMNSPSFQEYLTNAGIPLDSVAPGEVFDESIRREHDEAVEALTGIGLM